MLVMLWEAEAAQELVKNLWKQLQRSFLKLFAVHDVKMQKLCFYRLEKEFWFLVFFLIFSGKTPSGGTDVMCASRTCGARGQGTTFYHMSATLYAADSFCRL